LCGSGSDGTWFRPTRRFRSSGFSGLDERRRRVAGADRMTIEEVVRKVLPISTPT
jgi:hypothetical protein